MYFSIFPSNLSYIEFQAQRPFWPAFPNENESSQQQNVNLNADALTNIHSE
jgi:hypothetical protein